MPPADRVGSLNAIARIESPLGCASGALQVTSEEWSDESRGDAAGIHRVARAIKSGAPSALTNRPMRNGGLGRLRLKR
jgi:hypothetical protein